MANVPYDTKLFTEAHRKFYQDPTSLTDGDIQQFEIVSAELAKEARLRQSGYTKDWKAGCSDAEKKALMAPVTLGFLAQHEADYWAPILATYRFKNRLLEKRISDLQSTLNLAGKELDDMRTLVNYLAWAREEEPAVKP